MSAMDDVDLEAKNAGDVNADSKSSLHESDTSILSNGLTRRLLAYGVEEVGVQPIPECQRTDTKYRKVWVLWASMNISLIPLSLGIIGTLSYGLSLLAASLTILFFSLLCTVPVAYLATLGPKTGMRQMIQARYSFGIVCNAIPVILNLATMIGYCAINGILGAQALSAVSGNTLSLTAGIVIISIISLAVSFCGYRALHIYEAYCWIPALICIVIAVGSGGKNFRYQEVTVPATAPVVLSFGALVAGYIVPYAALGSDFFVYAKKDAPTARLFWYTYLGLLVPVIPLMVLGAAMGCTVPVLPDWTQADNETHIGGILLVMLKPLGGFGKFVGVLLALSVVGNITATFYSCSINFQVLFPPFAKIPRYVFAVLVTAIIIPFGIFAARKFYDALINFLGLIGYWSSAYVAIVLVEHFVFRRSDADSYKPSHWNSMKDLPIGAAALGAGCCSVAVIVPSMYQIWYEGPIAAKTGDIAFELAFVVAGLTYLPLRWLEKRLVGR